jgi:sulfur carrier protein
VACPVAQRASRQEMIIKLRNPNREIAIAGPRSAGMVLESLGLAREAHLVIRNGTLVPGDFVLDDDDIVEIRPVISGG